MRHWLLSLHFEVKATVSHIQNTGTPFRSDSSPCCRHLHEQATSFSKESHHYHQVIIESKTASLQTLGPSSNVRPGVGEFYVYRYPSCCISSYSWCSSGKAPKCSCSLWLKGFRSLLSTFTDHDDVGQFGRSPNCLHQGFTPSIELK